MAFDEDPNEILQCFLRLQPAARQRVVKMSVSELDKHSTIKPGVLALFIGLLERREDGYYFKA